MKLHDGILTSNVFDGEPVLHGFTTRARGNLGFGKNPGDPEVIANRIKLFDALALSKRVHVQPRQIHSNLCIDAGAFVSGSEADASVSRSTEHLLSILTADCLPVLAYHPEGFVVAIHAGWRGILHDIIPQTLALLPSGIKAVVGPSIGVCCYEIDHDFASEFANKFGDAVLIENKKTGKPHLDLQKAALQQLQAAGAKKCEISNLCTYCRPDLFFSYRRDGSSGRMMSYIALQ